MFSLFLKLFIANFNALKYILQKKKLSLIKKKDRKIFVSYYSMYGDFDLEKESKQRKLMDFCFVIK